jgi:hypothetical protein
MQTGHDGGAGAARSGRGIGRVARLVIDTLAGEGFGTQTREWEELWNLTITGARHGRSCLTVGDDGYLRWDYEPGPGPDTSPAALAALALRLLGAAGSPRRPVRDDAYPALLLKGAVGRLLEERGMKVGLLSFEDLESFEVVAEIEVMNPARPQRGKVRITDNGDVEWICQARDAFGGDVAAVVAVIAPILREGLGRRESRLPGA